MSLPSNLQAVVLCGGAGRRLRSVVPDRPKCLAPIGERPFLEYLLLRLRLGGVTSACLAVGYKRDQIIEHFGCGSRWGISLSYSVEQEPLGTAGALKNAAPFVERGPFLVLNGDSLLEVPYRDLLQFHEQRQGLATLALCQVSDVRRYGRLRIDAEGCVVGYLEKAASTESEDAGPREGLAINGGVYVFRREIFAEIPDAPPPVSLETDIFPRLIGRGLLGFLTAGFFIDIGIPEDYQRAQKELPLRFQPC
jgi:D-glycero-alpha-D-manno-heptose 1-phosphate guanylyltransferase